MVEKKTKRVLNKNSLNLLVKSLAFVLCGLFFAILLWQYNQNRITSLQYLDKDGISHTLTLSVKDKESLAEFMQILFAQSNFAYTLVGSKPLSWENFQNPLPFSNWTSFYDSFSKYHRTVRSGWKTWEKYQHLFPSTYFFAENTPSDRGYTSILMINKDRFNDVVNENKQDFQKVLGRDITDGFQLLEEAKHHSLMHEVLGGHQALLGMVLGYGRDNAWKFHEGCKTRTAIGWVWEEEEYDPLEHEKESDNDSPYYQLVHYSCPSFSGDPHSEESKALKKEYLLTKQKILEYYKDKDFLEATLSLLAGYDPWKASQESITTLQAP